MDDRNETPQRIDVISRRDFLREWDYGPGQHLTMLGPTQRGKTYLSHQLLHSQISPKHKAVILSGKPPGRDPVMSKAAQRLNLRVVDEWPPPPNMRPWHKYNGYVLRPHQSLRNLDDDNANVRRQFRAAMISNYASKKPVITVVDEAHHVQNDMGLRKEYEAPLMRGAPINAEWSLIQRGRFMSYHAYDAPEHLFIFYDPDASNVKRYSEIGGVDPQYVQHVVRNLNTYRSENGGTISECLYIKRSGPEMMIIDVK